MVKFTGKFKRKSAENYDEFLSQVGVGFMLRKAATASTPTMEISVKKLRTFCPICRIGLTHTPSQLVSLERVDCCVCDVHVALPIFDSILHSPGVS